MALVPGWLLPLRQPQELPSGRRQTPAWGPEGRGSAAAVSPPQTPNPGSKTKVDTHQTKGITSASLRRSFISFSSHFDPSKLPLLLFILYAPSLENKLKGEQNIIVQYACTQAVHSVQDNSLYSYSSKLRLYFLTLLTYIWTAEEMDSFFYRFNEVMKQLLEAFKNGTCVLL